MKLISCDGRTLEVRNLGPVVFRLTSISVPIKVNGKLLLEDAEARAILRGLIDSELYEGGKV